MSKLKDIVQQITKTRNTHSKILFTLIIFICATIIITSFTLYSIFERIMQYQIFVSESENLSQACYSADVLFNNAKTSARQIFYDRDFETLRLYSEINDDDFSRILNKLESQRYLSDFVSSIYIYSNNSNTIFTTTGVGNPNFAAVSSFFDKDAMDYILNYSQYPFMIPIPRRIPIWSSGNDYAYLEGYSFVFYENPGASDKLDSAVIINVDETWMQRMVNQLSSGSSRDTFIITNNGTTVINSSRYPMLSDISDKEFVQQVLKLNKEAGYFINDVDGVKSLIIHVPYTKLGWTYIRTIPYDMIIKKITEIRYITLLIALIILVLASVFSFLQSKRLSKPIDTAMAKLKQLEGEKSDKFLAYQQEYLKEILAGKINLASEKELYILESYKIKMRVEDEFLLLLFMIDNYDAFCTGNNLSDRDLLKFCIMNIASELLGEAYDNDVIDVEENAVLAVLSKTNSEEDFEKEKICGIIEDIQTQVQKHLKISLSCLISPLVPEAAYMPEVYGELVQTSDYRLFYGLKCIIFAEALAEIKNREYSYPVKKEKALTEYLIAGNTEEVKRIFNEIADDAVKSSVNSFTITITRLIFAIAGIIEGIDKNGEFPINIRSFITEINRMESINDIKDAFYEIFDTHEARNNERKKQKYDIIVEKIIELVNTRYSDPNLSVQLIADMVNFSPAYTSHLFKQATKKSIVDYINETRIFKAKELIVSTSLRVNDVVQKTGFTNATYFYKVFKKNFGITPNEMRRIL